MHDVISGLEIGITKALTALLVNRADAIVWNLNGHYTKNESLNAVNQLQQEVAPQNPDPLDGLETYINHAHFVSFGNRHDKADVVILETTVDAADHTGFLFSSRTKGQIIEKLHTLSNNVIVFGIGHLFQRSNLREIATDDEHLFLLNDVTELPSYVERAKSLICS